MVNIREEKNGARVAPPNPIAFPGHICVTRLTVVSSALGYTYLTALARDALTPYSTKLAFHYPRDSNPHIKVSCFLRVALFQHPCYSHFYCTLTPNQDCYLRITELNRTLVFTVGSAAVECENRFTIALSK